MGTFKSGPDTRPNIAWCSSAMDSRPRPRCCRPASRSTRKCTSRPGETSTLLSTRSPTTSTAKERPSRLCATQLGGDVEVLGAELLEVDVGQLLAVPVAAVVPQAPGEDARTPTTMTIAMAGLLPAVAVVVEVEVPVGPGVLEAAQLADVVLGPTATMLPLRSDSAERPMTTSLPSVPAASQPCCAQLGKAPPTQAGSSTSAPSPEANSATSS